MMDVDLAIRTRRTVKHFSGAPIPRAVIDELLDAACWAPTHRLTQPWRFAVLDQAAIARLGTFLAAEPAIAAAPDPAKGAAKIAKLLERLPTLGAMILVTWTRDADPAIDLEEHAAASAAVQNLLLAATARGVASFWSSTPALGHAQTLRWCGADPEREGFIGAIWLGMPMDAPPTTPPRRPLAERVRYP